MKKLYKNITFWVAIAGVLGYILAHYFGNPQWATGEVSSSWYQFIILIKKVFLQMLKMMIAPIVFFSLIGGMSNIGGIARFKAMGGVTVGYYLLTTMIAIGIGLTVVLFIHPWTSSGVTLASVGELVPKLQAGQFIDGKSQSLIQVFERILAQALVNPFSALAEGNIMGIVANSIFLGVAMILVLKIDAPIFSLVEQINRVLHKVLGWIILTSPIGIFAIVFDFSLKVSGSLFTQLLSFSAVVFAATMVHGLVVLPIILKLFGGISPLLFFKKAMRPLLIALGTSSSSATLPITMQTCEEELGISTSVSGFVFPLGATMNMDGTALFEGIAAVFLAHLYGIDLSTTSMVVIFLMAMISSIGAPGMPSGSMSGMQMVLVAAGIPLEAIGILMVIERPLDTFRTAVNVEGDMVGAMVVQNYLNKRK